MRTNKGIPRHIRIITQRTRRPKTCNSALGVLLAPLAKTGRPHMLQVVLITATLNTKLRTVATIPLTRPYLDKANPRNIFLKVKCLMVATHMAILDRMVHNTHNMEART